MINFKYQKYLEVLFVQCPPSDYTSQEKKAFRFVFEPTHKNYQNNFWPVLILKPARNNGRRFKKDSSKCQGYALSFFETLKHIKERYIELKRDNPNIGEQIGTHIAQGIIKKEDGLVSPVDKKGHFSLHEFDGTQLEKQFSIICPLE